MDAPEEIKPPICPHCSTEMPTVNLFNWVMAPWLIMEIHCPNCKKALHFQVVPVAVAESAASQPPPRPRIVS